MSHTVKNFRFWILQLCAMLLLAGLIYGCNKGSDETASSAGAAGGAGGPGAAMKGGMPGAGMKGGMPGAAMKGGMPGAGMKGGMPGAAMKGGMPGAGGGPGAAMNANMPMAAGGPGAAMTGGMGMGGGAAMGAGAETTASAGTGDLQLPEDVTFDLKQIVPKGITAENIKNWDGKTTQFLKFKARGPVGQVLNVHLPIEYKTKKLSKIGWSNLFLVYAMNEEARIDAVEKNKLPDVSSAGDMMKDILGTTETPAQQGRGGLPGMRAGGGMGGGMAMKGPGMGGGMAMKGGGMKGPGMGGGMMKGAGMKAGAR
jgi:hypothetical protein